MDQKIAERWVAALRSGEYRQGKFVLRNGDHFCCLGVLCDLYSQDHPEVIEKDFSKGTFLNRSFTLPDEVADWAGMESTNGTLWTQEKCLSYLNDTGASFDSLASLIETYREEL